MRDSLFRKYGDKLLFILALVVLAAGLLRLGFGKTISHAVAPEIVFTQWWQNDLDKETLDDLIKEFENLHPDIKVVLKYVSYEDLRSDLFSPVNPGEASPGDVLALDPIWVPALIKSEAIENENYPLLSFINVLFYNIPMLKEAGFTKPPKNRTEFLSYAKAVTDKEKNRWGLTMGTDSSRGIYDDVYPWIWSAGAQLFRNGKPNVNSRPVIDTLSFLAGLNSEGLISPNSFSEGADEKLESFISGKSAFMIAPSCNIRLLRDRMGEDNFGISSIPIPDNYAGKTYYASTGWSAGVSSGSSHKEDAKLFASFLAEKSPVLSEKANAIPGFDTPPAADLLYSKAWDIAIAGEDAQDFSGLVPEYEMEQIFREELLSLFAGKTSPGEAAAAIQKSWEEKL